MHIFTVQRRGESSCSTWGDWLNADSSVICRILERGAKNPSHIRIPAGTYDLARKPLGASHFDGAFQRILGATYKGILWLPKVPGRSNIEIHTANFFSELLGCLATATVLARGTDGNYVAAHSKDAYAKLYPIVSAAIDAGGAQLAIRDIGQV